jgi:hypothetical protein
MGSRSLPKLHLTLTRREHRLGTLRSQQVGPPVVSSLADEQRDITVERTKTAVIAIAGVSAGLVLGATGIALASDNAPLPPGQASKPFGGEDPVALSRVPAWIQHTAENAVQGSELTSVEIDRDDTEVIYEFAGTLGESPLEVDVRADGSLEEIELTVEPDAVSPAAAALFAARFEGFTTTKIEQSTRPTRNGLHEIWFEWDGTLADGTAVDIEVDYAGSTYLVEPD